MDVFKVGKIMTTWGTGITASTIPFGVWSFINGNEEFGYFTFVFVAFYAVVAQWLHVQLVKEEKRRKANAERIKKFYGGNGGCS